MLAHACPTSRLKRVLLSRFVLGCWFTNGACFSGVAPQFQSARDPDRAGRQLYLIALFFFPARDLYGDKLRGQRVVASRMRSGTLYFFRRRGAPNNST